MKGEIAFAVGALKWKRWSCWRAVLVHVGVVACLTGYGFVIRLLFTKQGHSAQFFSTKWILKPGAPCLAISICHCRHFSSCPKTSQLAVTCVAFRYVVRIKPRVKFGLDVVGEVEITPVGVGEGQSRAGLGFGAL